MSVSNMFLGLLLKIIKSISGVIPFKFARQNETLWISVYFNAFQIYHAPNITNIIQFHHYCEVISVHITITMRGCTILIFFFFKLLQWPNWKEKCLEQNAQINYFADLLTRTYSCSIFIHSNGWKQNSSQSRKKPYRTTFIMLRYISESCITKISCRKQVHQQQNNNPHAIH